MWDLNIDYYNIRILNKVLSICFTGYLSLCFKDIDDADAD